MDASVPAVVADEQLIHVAGLDRQAFASTPLESQVDAVLSYTAWLRAGAAGAQLIDGNHSFFGTLVNGEVPE